MIGGVSFEATLLRLPTTGSWVFAPVPEEYAPPIPVLAFGRVPVVATVDGRTWATSVWRDKQGEWLLPVPLKIRRGKDHGDTVTVDLELDDSRL
jgi:Domain of unknown function (DUF1905)